MNIYFKAKVKGDFDSMEINTAIFTLKNGTTITIDRKSTSYYVSKDGIMKMAWNDVYVWAVNRLHIFNEVDTNLSKNNMKKLLDEATVSFETESESTIFQIKNIQFEID